MTDDLIHSREQVTPEWLTEVLARSGALENGQVTAIEVDSRARILSASNRLRIAHFEESKGLLPDRLFLKTVDADMDEAFFGPSEVNHYRRDNKSREKGRKESLMNYHERIAPGIQQCEYIG